MLQFDELGHLLPYEVIELTLPEFESFFSKRHGRPDQSTGHFCFTQRRHARNALIIRGNRYQSLRLCGVAWKMSSSGRPDPSPSNI
jgi:hypothetical protein